MRSGLRIARAIAVRPAHVPFGCLRRRAGEYPPARLLHAGGRWREANSSSPAVLPHRCQFGQALFNLLVTRPARPRPAGGRGMLLVFFLLRKVLFWFSEGAKPPSGVGGFTPPIHPRIPPKIPQSYP